MEPLILFQALNLNRKASEFTPKALHNTAQGRGSAPWEDVVARVIYPERVAQRATLTLCNPFGVDEPGRLFGPRVRCRDPGLCCITPLA